jgi:uncharacterized glyoxalase superfamily protein PhnB
MGLTPIMLVDNAVAAIDFYHRAFGAKEISRLNAPRGEKLMHVRMEIEGSTLVFMDDLADLTPAASHARLPKTLGGTSVTLHLQVADAKSLWEKALQAGAVAVVPLQEMLGRALRPPARPLRPRMDDRAILALRRPRSDRARRRKSLVLISLAYS